MADLISPFELAALAASDPSLLVLDVRWRLDRPDGRPEYLAGHLPGAVFVDLDRDLARQGRPDEGRHPLPTTEHLQDAARSWGLHEGQTVVIYDDWDSIAAARAWWLLTRSGVDDVRVLDGGLRAWTAARLPLEEGSAERDRGDVELDDITEGVATIDDAAAWSQHGVLLDVRAGERYRGEVEPMDPVAGHIPGAVNLPAGSYLEDGRFLTADRLRETFAAVGAGGGVPVAAYCGSGITSAHTALAGSLAGIDVTVYPGSWSQWSNTPGRPVATGAAPG